MRQSVFDGLDAVIDLGDVAGDFLAEGQGHGVHEVGAAHFDDVAECLGFFGQAVAQELLRAGMSWSASRDGGDVHGGGEGVVGGLGLVDVVVGMDRVLGAQGAAGFFDGAVADHLVDVHVGLGAGAGLPDDEREVIVELAGDDFIAGGDDQLFFLGGQEAELRVDDRGGLLDEG